MQRSQLIRAGGGSSTPTSTAAAASAARRAGEIAADGRSGVSSPAHVARLVSTPEHTQRFVPGFTKRKIQGSSSANQGSSSCSDKMKSGDNNLEGGSAAANKRTRFPTLVGSTSVPEMSQGRSSRFPQGVSAKGGWKLPGSARERAEEDFRVMDVSAGATKYSASDLELVLPSFATPAQIAKHNELQQKSREERRRAQKAQEEETLLQAKLKIEEKAKALQQKMEDDAWEKRILLGD